MRRQVSVWWQLSGIIDAAGQSSSRSIAAAVVQRPTHDGFSCQCQFLGPVYAEAAEQDRSEVEQLQSPLERIGSPQLNKGLHPSSGFAIYDEGKRSGRRQAMPLQLPSALRHADG